MKIYSCKICEKRKERFSGTRQMVRRHLRQEHSIRGKRIDFKGDKTYGTSPITLNTIAVEI